MMRIMYYSKKNNKTIDFLYLSTLSPLMSMQFFIRFQQLLYSNLVKVRHLCLQPVNNTGFQTERFLIAKTRFVSNDSMFKQLITFTKTKTKKIIKMFEIKPDVTACVYGIHFQHTRFVNKFFCLSIINSETKIVMNFH